MAEGEFCAKWRRDAAAWLRQTNESFLARALEDGAVLYADFYNSYSDVEGRDVEVYDLTLSIAAPVQKALEDDPKLREVTKVALRKASPAGVDVRNIEYRWIATDPILSSEEKAALLSRTQHLESRSNDMIPPEIKESLERFRRDHPDPQRTAFVLMRFGRTKVHDLILKAIRDTLASKGIDAVRADDKEYHEDLFSNVLTYIHGCGLGVAVFERLEAEDFNPNVSLEVGYMFAQRKPVCLLKDQTLRFLQTDLVGKLYRVFDPQDAEGSIRTQLAKWVTEKNLGNDQRP